MHKENLKYLDQYLTAQTDFYAAGKKPYFKETEKTAYQIFSAYRDAYRDILNDIYRDTATGDLHGIFNEEISDAFKNANSPVGIFLEQIENGDLRCFSGSVVHPRVCFDCENNRFLISTDSFEYPLTVEEFKKSLDPEYIDCVMDEYKKDIQNIIYKNRSLENKRYQRLKEMYMQENIER